MTNKQYTRLKVDELTRLCRTYFKVDLAIKYVVFDDITTSKNSLTTVFRTEQDELYAVCVSDSGMNLADVKYNIKSMGMEAHAYFPPAADQRYFARYGHDEFLNVFPGRKPVNTAETLFYQSFAPYNPALVSISRVNGEIRRYNAIADKWQKDSEYQYTRTRV